MSGRGRRLALILAFLALALSVGHWSAVFLTERLWEATVSEAVAVVGTRRAILGLALEWSGLMVAVAWVTSHFVHAARVALPDQAPPEHEDARLWPAGLPRWTLVVAGVLIGVFVGSGAGTWLDELLLTLDGVRLGVIDPLLGADLGVFLRDVPLWLDVQGWALALVLTSIAGVLLIHVSGGTLAIADRRLGVSPLARGQFAVLLAALAAVLAWGALLEPYRLAAGARGPIQGSEFVLRMLIAEVSAGLLAAAGAATLLWWIRPRGLVMVLAWSIAGLGLAATAFLPVRRVGVLQDGEWQSAARALDSVAYSLGGMTDGAIASRDSLAALTPTLWDEPVLQQALAEGGTVPSATRGFIPVAGRQVPVWLVLRIRTGAAPTLVAVSDGAVSGSGGPLTWKEGDSTSLPGLRSYRDLPIHGVRTGGEQVEAAAGATGIPLTSWSRRLMLTWALQSPLPWRGPIGERVILRLDPLERLNRVIPFVHWTKPQPVVLDSSVVWISDGLFSASVFPSSRSTPWAGRQVAMVRPMLTAVVSSTSGAVTIFRQNDTDSISSALARISRPLIRPALELPAGIAAVRRYPEELLLAQAEVLTGPAWRVGRIDRASGESPLSVTAGGTSAVVTFLPDPPGSSLSAALVARRTPSGDSLSLIRFDSLHLAPSRDAATERWDRLPFQFTVRDSVRAVKDSFEAGRIRYEPTREGLLAYRPSWSVDSVGRARLVIVNLALRDRLGTGRTWSEAWRNYRNEISPLAAGDGAAAVLEQARLWMGRADSALRRGDLVELGRALANLRELLSPLGRKP